LIKHKDVRDIQKEKASLALRICSAIFLLLNLEFAKYPKFCGGANIGREAAEDSPSKNIHDRLSDVGLLLLQFSGALGLDLISILKARIEKEEMSVI
jgi:hypothetical protein